MALMTLVSGAAWPTSGAASAGTIGCNAISGTITHVGTPNVPPGSAATGVLRVAENVLSTLRLDALANVAPVVGNHYWLRFWVRGVRTANPAPASRLDQNLVVYDGTRLLAFQFQTNSSGALGWTPLRSDSAIAGGAADSIMVESGPEAVIPWGTASDNEGWAEIVLHAERHGTTGTFMVYVDGNLWAHKTGINTDQLWTTGLSASSWQLIFPAWSGIQWEISGPLESRNGTDIVITPQHSRVPGEALANKFFLPFCTQQASGALSLAQGCHGIVSSSGTVTVDSEYLNQAGSPCRHRLVFAGDGNSPTWTTLQQVGALPYNEQGWAHLGISDLLVPTTSSNKGIATWQVFKTGGAPLWQFQINSGSLFGAYDGGPYITLGGWTHATARYAVLLHLNRDGRAAITFIDLTGQAHAASGNVSISTSAPLPNWTPQDIGTLSLTAIPNGANNIEMGFMGVFRRPTLFALDSLATSVHTPGSGNTTTLQNTGCIARSFPMQRECQLLPGTHWPLRQLGLERRVMFAPLGRSGLRRVDFTRNALAGLLHTCGVEVLQVDGGSINDLAVIANGDPASVLARVTGNFEAFLRWAVGNDNAAWVTTMLPRSLRALTVTGITAANPAVVTFDANHGLTGPIRVIVTGVVGNATMQNAVNGVVVSAATVPAANQLTLVGVNTTGGTYTSGGVAVGFTANELTAIASLNAAIRSLISKWQRAGLLTLSDIERDAVANPGSYPNAATYWTDFTHPKTGTASTDGAQLLAERVVASRATPPANPKRRRWPLRLLGR